MNNKKTGTVRCTVCPRNCAPAEGDPGFCGVRANRCGRIVSLVYGLTTGLSVDPVEKKPLFHFLPGSRILSFGTPGCNMGCLFCQNWQMSKSVPKDVQLYRASPEDIACAASESGCSAVAFTYNDPVVFYEYAADTAAACHRHGIRAVAVSAGYVNPEARGALFSHMDAANIDLKGFSENFYRKNCGASLAPVLETLEYIAKETSCWLEITTLLIEGENDSDDMLKAECAWILEHLGPDVPLHLSAFYPAYRMTDRPPTFAERLLRAHRIASAAGLRYVYTGNIRGPETETTYCASCGKPLILRDRYRITGNRLTDGRCPDCGAACPGLFQNTALRRN